MKEAIYALIIMLLIMFIANVARAQPFETREEANAHFEACVHTIWGVDHIEYNPCAAELSIGQYGLYLFGYKENVLLYGLYNYPVQVWEWTTLKLATEAWEKCAEVLQSKKDHVTACKASLAISNDHLEATGKRDIILFVSSRSVLAKAWWWTRYHYLEPVD